MVRINNVFAAVWSFPPIPLGKLFSTPHSYVGSSDGIAISKPSRQEMVWPCKGFLSYSGCMFGDVIMFPSMMCDASVSFAGPSCLLAN